MKPIITDLFEQFTTKAIESLGLWAEANQRVLAVMRNRAADPDFASFAASVAGTGPLLVMADVCVELPEAGFRSRLASPATSDLAVHAFDQIQVLIDADPVWVSCIEVATPFLSAHCSVTSIVVTFADGSVFNYRGGFAGPGLRTPATGLWRVDGPDTSNRWDGNLADRSRTAVPTYQTCITAMIDAVIAGTAATSQTATLRSLALLDAALTSAGSDGITVTVQPTAGMSW